MKLRAGILSALMLASGLFAFWLVPKTLVANQSIDFDTMVPTAFGRWHAMPDVRLVTAQEPDSLERELYSRLLTRAYVDDANHVVMLLLAYGPTQTDRLQLHRPEICYVANGFRVGKITQTSIDVAGEDRVPVKRLVATREGRVEYITYWMRIGNRIANNVMARQLIKLSYGFRGIVPDGLLVRTSVIGSSQDAYALQDQFINALASNASEQLRTQILGHHAVRLANADLAASQRK